MELQKHRGRWTIRYRDEDGRRRRKALPVNLPETLTPEERVAVLREARAAIGGEPEPLAGATFADFLAAHPQICDHYQRQECVRPVLARIAARLANRPMASVTTIEAEDALASLRVGPGTFVVYRSFAARAWGEAVRRGLCAANPWAGVRRPRVAKRPVPALTEEEVARLLAACPAPHRPIIEFLYETGLRVGEARALVVEDVTQCAVTVRRSKTGRPRVVPLSSRAAEIVAGLDRERGIGRVRHLFPPRSLTVIRRALVAACARAGLPHLRVHDLRHLCAVRLVRLGANLADVRDLLGHASIAMTERYAGHAPDAGARRAVAVLQRMDSRTADRSTR